MFSCILCLAKNLAADSDGGDEILLRHRGALRHEKHLAVDRRKDLFRRCAEIVGEQPDHLAAPDHISHADPPVVNAAAFGVHHLHIFKYLRPAHRLNIAAQGAEAAQDILYPLGVGVYAVG